jgi:hypothetical protein
MEVVMIRVIRLTALGVLALALGLGPIGCGGETSAPKINKAAEDAKMEGKKKMGEQMQRRTAGRDAGEEDKSKDDKSKEDKSKSGDKDKDK